MRKLFSALITAGALVGLIAMPAAAAHGGEPAVVVMKHLCNPSIQTVEQFNAVEDAGSGGQPGGRGTLPGLVATVAACPGLSLTGDTQTPGSINSGTADMEFTVTDSAGAAYTLTADGAFTAAALCEDKVNIDINGNGIKADECLDVSMYAFSPTAEGAVTITETKAPGSSRFGTIRFTPASTDEMALTAGIPGEVNPIVLDTTKDTQVDSPPLPLDEYNDDVVVVHVYNFQPPASMSNTATESQTPNSLPLTLFGFGFVLAAAAVGTRLAFKRNAG